MEATDTVLEAWRLLLEAHRLLAVRLDRELQDEHGIGLDWYDVLYQLNAAGGRLRMHELSDATLFSRTDCTRLVDRMQTAGLVERERATDDRRGVYAVLTASGKSTLREAATTHLDGIGRLFAAPLRSAEVPILEASLRRIIDEAG